MNNLASNPQLMALAIAAATTELQKHVDVYVAAYKQTGYTRFDRPILDEAGNTVATELLTEFRAVAKALDSRMEFAKTDQVIQFIRRALPKLVMPEITLIKYPERPAREVLNPETGALELKRALKAQVVASFGNPPSRLSAVAQARNTAVDDKWASIFGAVAAQTPPAPEAPTASAPTQPTSSDQF